jgi:DNA-binding transcriptional LysR family regulator
MLDWDDVRYFLAVARHGSLTAAGRALRVTQSTVGRRLEGLERRLGVRLLQRTPDGYVLTAAGEGVLAHAERIEAEAIALERAVGGRDVRLEGDVRLTSVDTFATRILLPILASIRRRYPGIALEVITDQRSLSLSKREADIAIRFAPLDQHDVAVRRLASVGYRLYAARRYLEERGGGAPDLAAGAEGHMLIRMHEERAGLPEERWLSDVAGRAQVALRSNSRDLQVRAAVQGLGLACLPCYLGDPEPDLVRLTAARVAPTRDIWLGVHRDTRHVPRIRAVLDALAQEIHAASARLDPPA